MRKVSTKYIVNIIYELMLDLLSNILNQCSLKLENYIIWESIYKPTSSIIYFLNYHKDVTKVITKEIARDNQHKLKLCDKLITNQRNCL